ncbi:hypothetical protein [Leptospira kanakyensis]|uniref:hypothetical protein n=1 Tax=Leptospira kanakyensis TaxID=2484968 RepID=UPI00223E1ADA|nr:hypothetical protein [Leptospira kanakyensis]MCW7471770.1 hypothetical protein [Leptospira kanakyensis]MCW7483326.1 hypothetical protein [Leptospira kanakyensis]
MNKYFPDPYERNKIIWGIICFLYITFVPIKIDTDEIFILIPDRYCFYVPDNSIVKSEIDCGFIKNFKWTKDTINYKGIYEFSFSKPGFYKISELNLKSKVYYYSGNYTNIAFIIFLFSTIIYYGIKGNILTRKK